MSNEEFLTKMNILQKLFNAENCNNQSKNEENHEKNNHLKKIIGKSFSRVSFYIYK